jgi:hypothetical protein
MLVYQRVLSAYLVALRRSPFKLEHLEVPVIVGSLNLSAGTGDFPTPRTVLTWPFTLSAIATAMAASQPKYQDLGMSMLSQ